MNEWTCKSQWSVSNSIKQGDMKYEYKKEITSVSRVQNKKVEGGTKRISSVSNRLSDYEICDTESGLPLDMEYDIVIIILRSTSIIIRGKWSQQSLH